MLKYAPCIVWRITVNALNLARELLLERFERKQFITEDEPVIEQIVIGDPMSGMIKLLRVCQQNPRLQLRPVFLADPGEFEFGFIGHVAVYLLPTCHGSFVATRGWRTTFLLISRAAETLKSADPLVEMSTLTTHVVQPDTPRCQRTMQAFAIGGEEIQYTGRRRGAWIVIDIFWCRKPGSNFLQLCSSVRSMHNLGQNARVGKQERFELMDHEVGQKPRSGIEVAFQSGFEFTRAFP